jgi:hypothetical protein
LAAGDLEINKGDREVGRAHLEGLQNDCDKAGFVLIARRASAALRTASIRAGG